MSLADPIKVLCLAGPTGAGKSRLAISLARLLNGEIVNADSRQVYADFPILTAQPTAAEKQDIPHHLYGFLGMTERINAGKWAEMAVKTANEIAGRGRLPVFVGGTGLYFQALLHGLAQIPEIPDKIRKSVWERVHAEGAETLYRELCGIDAEYAKKVHPGDGNRIGRALEVYAGTGKSFSWWHKNSCSKPRCKGPLLVIHATPAELMPKLEARIEEMLEQGALEEASGAYARNPDASLGAWSAIGCAEFMAFLENRMTLQETKKMWLANTRAYAKRQLTWFRGRRETIWIPADISMDSLIKIAEGQKSSH